MAQLCGNTPASHTVDLGSNPEGGGHSCLSILQYRPRVHYAMQHIFLQLPLQKNMLSMERRRNIGNQNLLLIELNGTRALFVVHISISGQGARCRAYDITLLIKQTLSIVTLRA